MITHSTSINIMEEGRTNLQVEVSNSQKSHGESTYTNLLAQHSNLSKLSMQKSQVGDMLTIHSMAQ